MIVSLWKENFIIRKIFKMCKFLFLFFLNLDEEKVVNFFLIWISNIKKNFSRNYKKDWKYEKYVKVNCWSYICLKNNNVIFFFMFFFRFLFIFFIDFCKIYNFYFCILIFVVFNWVFRYLMLKFLRE